MDTWFLRLAGEIARQLAQILYLQLALDDVRADRQVVDDIMPRVVTERLKQQQRSQLSGRSSRSTTTARRDRRTGEMAVSEPATQVRSRA
jgi:hypothetical protein